MALGHARSRPRQSARWWLLLGPGLPAVASAWLLTVHDPVRDAPKPADAAGTDGASRDGLPGDSGTVLRSYREEVLADFPISYSRLGESQMSLAANEIDGGATGMYHGAVTLGVA